MSEVLLTRLAQRAPEPRLDAVLLDMGGVLIVMGNEAGLPTGDFDRAGREALLALLRERGGRAEPEQLERLLFAPWATEYERRYRRQREADWMPHLERLLGATGAQAQPRELLAAWFGPYGASLVPMPGAVETLAALRAMELRIGLVSNVALPGDFYRELLVRWEIAPHIEVFRFSLEAGSRKPAPRMLHEALATLGSAPAAAVMVGDRKASDVAAGRAAGTRTVWLRSAHDEGPEADAIIYDLIDLPALLAEWRAAAS